MDPFRKLFLDQVKLVLEKEAGCDALYELLKLASPSLTKSEARISSRQKLAYNMLRLRLHPDKHKEAQQEVTDIFQRVQIFYQDCLSKNLGTSSSRKKRKVNPVSPNGGSFPRNFHVQDTWSFLSVNKLNPRITKSMFREEHLTALIAARCINARGAIAHGRKTELSYSAESLLGSRVSDTVSGIFKRRASGEKVLDNINAIKQELTERGPVVSTTFILDQAFASLYGGDRSFLMKRVGQKHELLLVGWKMTASGEVWLAKPLFDTKVGMEIPIEIAFGQFGVDDVCLAPKNTFENTPWQAGPYFDRSLKDEALKDWPGMLFTINSKQLEELAIALGEGFHSAIENKSRVVLRRKNKRAASRAACLREVAWDKEDSLWKVEFKFTE